MSEKHALTERDQFWLSHIQAADGMSLSHYAAEHDLSVDRLYTAKSRLKHKGVLSSANASRFTTVSTPTGAPAPMHCRVLLRNGTVVEVCGELRDCTSLLEAAARLE